MYRLSIVDDELDVRSRLASLIDKAPRSFQIDGIYENGIDAYDGICSSAPDVVITDIKIPYIDGLELARRLREALPLIKIIVITGYDEFDYAKQAANLGGGIVGFLSKPITQQDINTVLSRAERALDADYLAKENLSQLEQFYTTNLPLIRETDLYRLCGMSAVTPQFRRRLAYNGIDISHGSTAFCIFDFDGIADEQDAQGYEMAFAFVRKCVPEAFGSVSGVVPYVFARHDSLCALLVCEQQPLPAELESAAQTVILRAQGFSGLSFSAGLSAVAENTDNFKLLYEQAMSALEYRSVMGGGRALYYGNLVSARQQSKPPAVNDSDIKQLGFLLRFKSESELKQALTRIKDGLSDGDAKSFYYYILSTALGAVINACADLTELNRRSCTDDMFRRLFEFKTIDEAFAFLEETALLVRRINSESIVDSVEDNLGRVVSYMDAHYADPDISLESLSRDIALSSSYIGALLKKNKNTTFVKYITSLRMERAKQLLLAPNIKILDVSEQLGFADPYYFSHCFKKYTGVSPKEFRENE